MHSKETTHSSQEADLLAVLKELQQLLVAALDSLGEVKPASKESGYVGWAAAHVNKILDGYLWMREPGRVDASKLMIRPLVETVLFVVAVTRERGFLFLKAFTEWQEESRLYAHDPRLKAKHQQDLPDLIREWTKKDASYPFRRKTVSCRDAAVSANLLPVYESAYRIYCKFTHGAMRAIHGSLDDMTDPIDTQIVIWGALVMLDQLKNHTQADVPDLAVQLNKVQKLIPEAFPPVKGGGQGE